MKTKSYMRDSVIPVQLGWDEENKELAIRIVCPPKDLDLKNLSAYFCEESFEIRVKANLKSKRTIKENILLLTKRFLEDMLSCKNIDQCKLISDLFVKTIENVVEGDPGAA